MKEQERERKRDSVDLALWSVCGLVAQRSKATFFTPQLIFKFTILFRTCWGVSHQSSCGLCHDTVFENDRGREGEREKDGKKRACTKERVSEH